MPLMKTYMFFFSRMKCFPDYTFSYNKHKKLRTSLLWVLRKKTSPARFSLKFMLPARSIAVCTNAIEQSHWQACIRMSTLKIFNTILCSQLNLLLYFHIFVRWLFIILSQLGCEFIVTIISTNTFSSWFSIFIVPLAYNHLLKMNKKYNNLIYQPIA